MDWRQRITDWCRAAGRFLRFAFIPLDWPWQVAEIVGITAVTVIALVQRIGWAWAIVVVAVLFFIAGARLERELRGDSAIGVECKVMGHEILLVVHNLGAASAPFTGRIMKAVPELRRAEWSLPWEDFGGKSEIEILGRSQRTLMLGHASLVRREDGLLGGSVALASTDADVPRNFEMSDEEYQAVEPLRIKVRIECMNHLRHEERCYQISLPYEQARTGNARPDVVEIGCDLAVFDSAPPLAETGSLPR